MGVISKGFLVRKKVVWSFNTLQSDFKIRKSAAEVGLDGIDCQTCSRGYDIGWMKLMFRLVEEVTTPQMRGRRERKGNCLPFEGGSMHGTL